ncbi:MAG: hypothetical protein L0H15_10995 [Nitrosospira sp.]|nr:hypothetical protein [Nitrosospira sp.]MDN5882914.1 hypothetical protein [Nitrosospira sp.]
MNKMIINVFKILALSTVFIGLMAGCTTTHRTTSSAKTAVEQLLISEAIARSLPREPTGALPIPRGSTVILDVSGISPAADQMLLQQALAAWLGREGYLIQSDKKAATHQIDVIVGALGTELSGTFVGMPPVTSILIPFSLPELAVYKSQLQTGYVKFHMNIFEIPAGRFVGSTPAFLGDAYHNHYTMALVVSFESSNLMSPPQLGSFFRDSLAAPHPILKEDAKFKFGE